MALSLQLEATASYRPVDPQLEVFMNTSIKSALFLIATATAVGLGRPTIARAEGEGLVSAKIPFDFIVGDTRLPAGDYMISETSSGPTVLMVESTDGTRVSLVSTISSISTGGSTARPDVQFETVGKEHFLSRVDLHDGMAREVVLSPSIMEHELAKADERSGD
jgi:hypothetical protein